MKPDKNRRPPQQGNLFDLKVQDLARWFGYLGVMCLTQIGLNAQVPNISYTSPQTLLRNVSVSILPTNTGGAVSPDITASGYAWVGTYNSATGMDQPAGVCLDAAGNMYIADTYNHVILKLNAAGTTLTQIAGTNGTAGSVNGTGAAARFRYPSDVVLSADETLLYVCDKENDAIRQIVLSTGQVTTIAGILNTPGDVTGAGTSAKFETPQSIILSSDGSSLYVTDVANRKVKKVVLSGSYTVSTLAGSGASGGSNNTTGILATFNGPQGITMDGSFLYVTEYDGHRIRKISLTSPYAVTTLAGSGTRGSTNGTGTAASFDNPKGITIDGAGNLYIADQGNNKIRKVTTAGEVTTLAGTGVAGTSVGDPTAAMFNGPADVYLNALGKMVVVDQTGNSLRSIEMNGYVCSVALPTGLSFSFRTGAISGTPTVLSSSTNYSVTAYNYHGNSTATLNLTVANAPTVSTTTASSVNTTSASSGGNVTNEGGASVSARGVVWGTIEAPTVALSTKTTDGTGTGSFSSSITGLTPGTMYYYRAYATNGAGTSYGTTSSFTTAETAPSISYASASYNLTVNSTITPLTITNTGGSPASLQVSLLAGKIQGHADGTGTAAKFHDPRGITLDVDGNLIVADASQHVIRRVTPQGVATTIAGMPGTRGFIDSTGSAARFNAPYGVAVDPDNNIYVSDTYNDAIRKITPAGVVSTVAGSATYGSTDGTGPSARFLTPRGIIYAPDGKLYIADFSNNRIRTMTTSGAVTTLAGSTWGFADGTGTSASFYNPSGVTADQSGNLYVTDYANRRIRKIVISSGLVTSIAGNGTAAVVDGTGTDAQFYVPWHLCMLRAGYLLVADRDAHVIRKVTPSGDVTTVIGQIGTYGFANGAGTSATLFSPNSIVEAPNGNIYVAESSGRIRLISKYSIEPALPAGLSMDPSTGTISGTPTAAMAAKTFTIRAQNSGGSATTQITLSVASAPTATTQAATNVSATTATLNATVNANGGTTTAITIKYSTVQADVDAGNGSIAAVSPTIASGNTNTAISASVTGLSASSVYYFRVSVSNSAGVTNGSTLSFTTSAPAPVISYAGASSPVSLSVGLAMTALSVTNTGGAIDQLQVTTLAGSISGFAEGSGTSAKFAYPSGVAVDGNGVLYVADQANHRIRKVTAAGVVTTFAGSTFGYTDGNGSSAQFWAPNHVAVEGSGNVYVADFVNNTIRKITPAGDVSTLAGSPYFSGEGYVNGTGTSARFNRPSFVAVDGSGNVLVSDKANTRIRKITPAGVVTTFAGSSWGYTDGTGESAQFNAPAGISVNGSGYIYVADESNHRIRKITDAGVVSSLAGVGTYGFVDGTGASAKFNKPSGIAVDVTGNVYVADSYNHVIRKVTPAGEVTTLVGSSSGFADGSGTSAKFNLPLDVAADGSGNLYVADAKNNRIRKVSRFSISPDLPAGLVFNTGTGEITGTATAISASQTYTVTASNAGGTGTTSFTLSVSASMMTTAASAIGETTCTTGGTVAASYTGITERGVVWHTATGPTIANNKQAEGATTTGAFTVNLTGLTANTTYYVRSYVTYGSSVTEYGNELTFKTNVLGTFADITKTFGDAKFSMTAPTALSTGAFTYASSNTGVATVSGSEVTITGAGTTNITATQAAAGAYASINKTLALTVARATPSITLNIPTTTTLAAANNMSITAGASNGETVTVAIGSGTATGTLNTVSGGYELNGVSASGNLVFNATTAATSNWEAGSKTVTMDVQKNSQTIGFTLSSPVTYSSGLSIPLTATSTTGSGSATGLTVGFSVVSGPASVSGSNLDVTSPGVIVVRASQSGNGTYNPAPEVDRTLTVNPGAPTITGFTPTSATEGDVVTITGTNFQNVTAVSFGGTAATSFNVVSATSITAVVGTGLSGSISVTTTGGTDTEAGFRYKVTWTGATNAFNTSSNWTGNRPPQTDDDIIFSPTAASDLELNGSKTVGNVDFNGSGRSLKLGAYNLTVKGNLTMPGNITGSGRVIMQGGTAQTIHGGGDIPDLEINNSNGVTIDAAGDELTVSGTLRSTAGALTTNGKLRLTSNSSGTARVGVVAGTITGNVIAERYIQRNENTDGTGRAWRLVSVPVTGTGTLRDFFMNGRSGQDLTDATVVNDETENSGTPIVGHNYATASEATTAGFDWIGVSNSVSSLRSYVGNTAGGSFLSENIPTLSTTYATADQGYMVFARGDRKLYFPNTTSSRSTTFRSTGSLKTGDQLVSVATPATSKYTLVGNPYMSVLNLDALYTTNSSVINPSFWIWDANISGTNRQGGYVNVYQSGGQWVTNTGTYINPELIESGMAFFVEPKSTLSSATNMTISESHKSSSAAAGLSPFSSEKPDDHGRMYIRLERADAKGIRQVIDGVMADFHASHKVALTDMSDREKLRNGISRGALWIPREGKTLSGEGLPWPKDVKQSIPLYMSGVGDQTLLVHINPSGMRDHYVAAWLKDNVLKREVEINMNQSFDYDFIGTGRADWDSTRFEIVYVEATRPSKGVTLEPDEAAETPSVKLYPNPSKTAEVKLSLRAMMPGTYSVQILDMTGRLVAMCTLEHRSVNGEYRMLQGRLLAPGHYLVRLMDADKQLKETLRMMVE